LLNHQEQLQCYFEHRYNNSKSHSNMQHTDLPTIVAMLNTMLQCPHMDYIQMLVHYQKP